MDHVVIKSHIYLQAIWGKLNIHIGNKPVFWDNFRHAVVIYISDLLDEDLALQSIEIMNLESGINLSFFTVVSTEISNSKKLVDSCR